MLIYDEGVRIANFLVLSWIPLIAFHYRAKMRSSSFFTARLSLKNVERKLQKIRRNKLLTEIVQYE